MPRPSHLRSTSRSRSIHSGAIFAAVIAVGLLFSTESLPGASGWAELGVSKAWAQSGADSLTDLDYAAESTIDPSAQDGVQQTKPSIPLRQGSPLLVEPIAPLAGPQRPKGAAAGGSGDGGDASSQTLGSAMQEMIRRNPVVAVVEGEEIRWKDVLESARDLPPEYRRQIESIFPALLDRLIDLKLLANAGRDGGLDEDEDLQRRVKAYEDILVRDAYVARNIASKIPEADVRTRYFAVLRANAALSERHLRHVVVKSRAEARAVVQSLDDGLDFAELARSYSTGDSASRGGDLGFMRRDSLDPGFAAEAFDLRVGDYSRRPFRTEFGWHVIKVESERKAVLPTYEELAPKLREELARLRINGVLKKLRADADMELFPEK
ncbi:peptidylprolyl isomerase [Pelagibius sp. Alg239-R121]|uniref:peptidylprolyl isomerase n=1 Tax=Pelagibius sp. Alg239-R121 TaxID=2993448 RepID=UPI0024A6ABE4|nr:peptidylprolyl isomerase [Pelagibius sp. Alg239-R121]